MSGLVPSAATVSLIPANHRSGYIVVTRRMYISPRCSCRAKHGSFFPPKSFRTGLHPAGVGKTRRLQILQALIGPGLSTETLEDRSRYSATTVLKLPDADSELQICRLVSGLRRAEGAEMMRQRLDTDDAVQAMLRHVDQGLTTFDMADAGGEELYGAMLDKIRRSRGEEAATGVQGLTKWSPPPAKMTSSVVRESIAKSRKRMGVNRIDLLQLHWFDFEQRGFLDALLHLTDLKEQGKIHAIGVANFNPEQLMLVLQEGIPIVSNQVQYSIVDTRPQRSLTELCDLTGVKIIAYGPLLGGLLSEKFLGARDPDTAYGPELKSASQRRFKRVLAAWGGWPLFRELLRECGWVASKHGVTVAAVALRYVLDQKCVASAVVGVHMGRSEHYKMNKAALSLRLDEEDGERLGVVTANCRDLHLLLGECGDECR